MSTNRLIRLSLFVVFVTTFIGHLASVSAQTIEEQLDEENEVGKNETFRKKLPVKIGPDGRPFLFGPNIELCKKRKLSQYSNTKFQLLRKYGGTFF